MDVLNNQIANSLCGTPEYLAPEILEQKGHGKPVDWWTLGNIIYEMMTGLPPFYNENRKEMFKTIKETQMRSHSRIQDNLQNLLLGLLEKDPNKRLGTIDGAKEIIDHPWFQDLRWDLLEERRIIPPFVPNLESDIDLKYVDSEFKEMSLSSHDTGIASYNSGVNSVYQQFTVGSPETANMKSSPQNYNSEMEAENSYEQINQVIILE